MPRSRKQSGRPREICRPRARPLIAEMTTGGGGGVPQSDGARPLPLDLLPLERLAEV